MFPSTSGNWTQLHIPLELLYENPLKPSPLQPASSHAKQIQRHPHNKDHTIYLQRPVWELKEGGKPRRHPLWIAWDPFPWGGSSVPWASIFSAMGPNSPNSRAKQQWRWNEPPVLQQSNTEIQIKGATATLSFPCSNSTFWPGGNSEELKGQGLWRERPSTIPRKQWV